MTRTPETEAEHAARLAAEAMRVRCPACGAEPGDPCKWQPFETLRGVPVEAVGILHTRRYAARD